MDLGAGASDRDRPSDGAVGDIAKDIESGTGAGFWNGGYCGCDWAPTWASDATVSYTHLEFQISVRSSIDRLNDVLAGMTADEQAPFAHARNELEKIDRALIERLFPRQPKAESEHGKVKPQ